MAQESYPISAFSIPGSNLLEDNSQSLESMKKRTSLEEEPWKSLNNL
jgi:hypothetical protein